MIFRLKELREATPLSQVRSVGQGRESGRALWPTGECVSLSSPGLIPRTSIFYQQICPQIFIDIIDKFLGADLATTSVDR